MKILLVHDYALPVGGAEVQVLGLRDRLRERGHDARLFASSAGTSNGGGLADVACFGTTSRFRTLVQTANPSAYWRLRDTMERFRPDVVHVKMFLTQLSPLILPLLRGVPSLYHAVWYRPVCPLGTKLLPDGRTCESRAGAVCYREGCLPLRDFVPLSLQMKMWRSWRSAFRLFVANSGATRRRLEDEGLAPIEVVWNGVPARAPRAPLTDPPTVVFAGRLVREKGVDVLLRAFAEVVEQLPAARLIVAGEGPDREKLSDLVAALNLASQVTMPGHLSLQELTCASERGWVQAVPSVWDEPFGNVAAESSMRGTAVVASRAGGLAEIVRDGETGLLVPPGDADALAAALLKLLGDRELAENLGRRGHEFALRHLDERAYADRLLGLYRRLLEEDAGRAANDRVRRWAQAS